MAVCGLCAPIQADVSRKWGCVSGKKEECFLQEVLCTFWVLSNFRYMSEVLHAHPAALEPQSFRDPSSTECSFPMIIIIF